MFSTDEDSNKQSEAYITRRLQQICDKVPSISTVNIINSYFSNTFKQQYKAVCKKYGSDDSDGMGFFGLYFWSGGDIQDGEIKVSSYLMVLIQL